MVAEIDFWDISGLNHNLDFFFVAWCVLDRPLTLMGAFSQCLKIQA